MRSSWPLIVMVVGCHGDLRSRLPPPSSQHVPDAWRLQQFPRQPSSFTAPDGSAVDAVVGSDVRWVVVGEAGPHEAAYHVERIARDGSSTTVVGLRTSAAPRLVPQRSGGVLVLSMDIGAALTTTLVGHDGGIRARTTLPLEGVDDVGDLQLAPGSDGVGASILFAVAPKGAPDDALRWSCRLLTIAADGQVAREWGGQEDDFQDCQPVGIAARGSDTVVVVRGGTGRTIVMALGDAGTPRWTQRLEPSCGVSWLGVAATDDTVALLSSYTEKVPPWRAGAGKPEPVKSIHVAAVAPGTGDVRWEYDVPLRGALRYGSAQIVAAGRSFVLLTRFPDDAYLLALDDASGATRWESVIRGDRGGSGYPAITRLGLVGGRGGELIVHGSYRRGIEIGGVTASAPSRYHFTDWTGNRHYDEPEVGFFASLR